MHNLIEAGDIPPSFGVFVHNAARNSRMVELTCNKGLPELFARDVVPLLQRAHGVVAEPARAVVSGCSLGGLSSLWLGFSRPDLFGNVLPLSGSFWWGEGDVFDGDARFGSEPEDSGGEWLVRQLSASERLPLRLWVDVGTLEVAPLPYGGNLLESNRRLRSVLEQKGYQFDYRERTGGHDWAGWRRAFGEGLRFLIGR
jgi:enterochelin esterase family protein